MGKLCFYCGLTGRRQDIWMVTVRSDCKKYGQDSDYVLKVFEQLKNMVKPDVSFQEIRNYNLTKRTNVGAPIRRRLSPGEQYLHRLRQAKPYRDSPVLTRLLEEIREA